MSFDINKPISGRVWKFGDSIDTDCINPYYKYPDPEELKKHTMESARPEFASQVKPGVCGFLRDLRNPNIRVTGGRSAHGDSREIRRTRPREGGLPHGRLGAHRRPVCA